MRYVDDQVYEALARLNVELAERGDPARVRLATVRPDPYLDDMWLVIATWELPDLPPGQDTWPLAELNRYGDLAWDSIKDLDEVDIHNLYRTRDELATDPQIGRPVPELV